MNIQPLSRHQVRGIAKHNFRLGPTPAHVDASQSHNNRVLYGNKDNPGALGKLPTHQPDTGRKIRKDARLVAAFVFTLPKELDLDHAKQVEWIYKTLEWVKTRCPGKLSYLVLHMDESRKHLQAGVLPVDDDNHFDYKRYFGSPEKLAALQKDYSTALEPLGVVENTEEVKAERSPLYNRGISGWRVGRKQLELEKKLREIREKEEDEYER